MQETIACTAAEVEFEPAFGRAPESSNVPLRDVALCDPLEPDSPSDIRVTLTHRQIGRLVFVAAETGSRFARERSKYDPAAWMAAPRHLFGGHNALTACVDRTMFMRALVLHGATPAYDMSPEEMALLLSPEDGEADEIVVEPMGRAEDGSAPGPLLFPWPAALFTATCVEQEAGGALHVFFATLASDESQVREQLRHRLGGRISYIADVEKGFDPSQPVAASLLSEAMVYLVEQIASEPTSTLAAGFNVLVEHRFGA